MTWKHQICLPIDMEPSRGHITVDVVAKMIMLDVQYNQRESLYGIVCNAFQQVSNEESYESKVNFITARDEGGNVAICNMEALKDTRGAGCAINGIIKIQNPTVEITANQVTIDASEMPHTVRDRIKVGNAINDIVDFHLIKDRLIREITVVNDDIYIDLVEQEPENWYDALPDFGWI